MGKFWVIFTHGRNRTRAGMCLSGPDGRAVAYEIRRKYRDVDIESIAPVRERHATTCGGRHGK